MMSALARPLNALATLTTLAMHFATRAHGDLTGYARIPRLPGAPQ
jgi:hypothetical protein